MTAVRWALFGKHWHPEARWWARYRAALLILSGYETEICGRCGGKVGLVWSAPDDVWLRYNGTGNDWGVLCIPCFDALAEKAGGSLYWECASGRNVFPSCTGQPCPHHESLMIVADQRDGYWDGLQEAIKQRDEYRDKWYGALGPPPSARRRLLVAPNLEAGPGSEEGAR